MVVGMGCGTIRTVGSAGTYASIGAANTTASNFDTIMFLENLNLTAGVTLKKGITLTSDSDDTLFAPTNGTLLFTAGGDSITLRDFNIVYPTGTYTGFAYQFSTTDFGGHRIRNVKITSLNTRQGTIRGIFLRRTSNTPQEPISIINCRFDSTYTAVYGGDHARTGSNDVIVDSCVFINTSCSFGENWVIKNSIELGGGENMVLDSANNMTIDNVWSNHNFTANEYYTWDENPYKVLNPIVRNCVFINGRHNDIMWDYWWNGTCSNCYFMSTETNDYSCIYNHCSENPAANDTVGYNCNFQNLTLRSKLGTPFIFGGSWNTTDTLYGIHLKNILIEYNGAVAISGDATRLKESTVDSLLFVKSNTILAGWTVTDTFNNRGKLYLLDTTYNSYFPYHRHSSIFAGKSSHKYLTNWKEFAYDITTTGFSVRDSIAKNFKHDNGYYAANFTSNNTWWTGDTVITRLMITTDTLSGSWSEAFKDTTVAGSLDTFTYSSGSASTKYFYRLISDGLTDGTTQLHDTTLIYNVTTDADANLPPTITVDPTNQMVDENHTATFTLTATEAEAYQWKRNSSNVGTSSNSYAFTAVLDDDGDSVWCIVSNAYGADTSDTVFLTVNDTIIPPDPPVLTVTPVSDTAVAGGTVSAFGAWTGTNVQVAWWYYHGADSTYTTDSVFTKTVLAANDGDSAKMVLWNTADTISAPTIYFSVVYAVFDTVNATDSNTIYVHGNFLSGSGWTATLSDSTLTTESGSETAQVFGYNHKITLSTARYELIITNGTYTVTLWIGRKKSTGNNKTRISIDIGL